MTENGGMKMHVTCSSDEKRYAVNINTSISKESLINFGHAVFNMAVEITAKKLADLYVSDFIDGIDSFKYKEEIINNAKAKAEEILATALIEHLKQS